MSTSRTKLVILSVLIITVFGIGAGFYYWASQPSVAKIDSSNQSKADQVKGTTNELKIYQTDFFSTKIPANLQQKSKTETPNTPIYGQYLFSSPEISSSNQLAITLGKRGLNTLSEISAVKYRLSLKTEYHSEPTPAGYPETSLYIVKNDGSEVSAFWENNDEYVGVVASSKPGAKTELQQIVNDVAINWDSRPATVL